MGMLLRPLDAILSSQSKVRLLPLEDGVSAREAARLARVPLPPALRALADLSELGVLHRAELRSQHLYTVAHDNPLVRDALVPLFEVERLRSILALKDRISYAGQCYALGEARSLLREAEAFSGRAERLYAERPAGG
jgi:hypothetical protein